MNRRNRSADLTPDRLSALCYQLWMIQRAGAPLDEGVSDLLEDAAAPWSRALLSKLHAGLSDGLPLSDALAESGDFPPHLLRMVKIGEAGGELEQVLLQLSEYYRGEAQLRDSLQKAVTYPALMALLISVVFLVLISRVLPVFLKTFEQLGLSASSAAASLLRFGTAGKYVAGFFSVLLALTAAAALFLFRTVRGTRFFSRRAGKYGETALAVGRSKFASALALMLGAGIPFDESFDRAAGLAEDSPLEPRVAMSHKMLSSGMPLPQALREARVFEGLQVGLLSAGFRAGMPEKAMNELARRCSDDADRRLGAILGRFEYGLVIALCGVVGLMLLSVMLPLLAVLSSVGV